MKNQTADGLLEKNKPRTEESIKLYDYQVKGAEFLASKSHALLAFDMGLGKTATTIRACDLINAQSILVICPAIARRNWILEFEKFSPTKREFALVETRKDADNAQFYNKHFIVVSYDLVSVACDRFKRPWDAIILDECHYLKSISTKRTKVILGAKGLVHNAKNVWALSGTPAPNHAGELWPLLYTFRATPYKYSDFINKYCITEETTYGTRILGTNTKQIPELKNALQKIMLRSTKESVALQLPSLYYSDFSVEPARVDIDIQSSFIKWVFPIDRRKELFEKLEEQKNILKSVMECGKVGTDANLMKMLEASASSLSTLRMYAALQKAPRVVEIVKEELENKAYEKIVIFAIHRDAIEMLRVGLRSYHPLTLYGKTPAEQRQRNINLFQKTKKYKVMICNIQAAGTAVTFTASHNVIFLEQDWVPGNNAQAAMRVHRIGQTKPVFVRFCALKDSVDERVTALVKRKTKELTAIFDEDRKTKTDSHELESRLHVTNNK